MFKKKYPLYYTTNELKRRRTMTDGKGKSSFFSLAESGIVLYFLIFSDLKYCVRRPPCRCGGLFLKAFLQLLHYLKQITISWGIYIFIYYYYYYHISFITWHFFGPTQRPLPRYHRHRRQKGVNFICIRAGLVVIVVGEFPRTHKRAFSVSIISLFILLPFTYI